MKDAPVQTRKYLLEKETEIGDRMFVLGNRRGTVKLSGPYTVLRKDNDRLVLKDNQGVQRITPANTCVPVRWINPRELE